MFILAAIRKKAIIEQIQNPRCHIQEGAHAECKRALAALYVGGYTLGVNGDI